MTISHAPFFDECSEPLEQRIATGLHKLSLAIKHEIWLRAKEDGLSPTQGQILVALVKAGSLNATELSRGLGVTLPTVSDSLRVLVNKGLVFKESDPRNPRASLVALTAAGRERAGLARSWPDFLAPAVAALPEAEQAALLSGLVKLIRSLQVSGQIPTSRMCVTCQFFRNRVHVGPMPHHCAFVDAPMASRHFRLDCAEHEQAPEAEQMGAW